MFQSPDSGLALVSIVTLWEINEFIQGDPGDGKTTLVLNIAARLSKGEGLDNDMKVTEPVKIFIRQQKMGWQIR